MSTSETERTSNHTFILIPKFPYISYGLFGVDLFCYCCIIINQYTFIFVVESMSFLLSIHFLTRVLVIQNQHDFESGDGIIVCQHTTEEG